MVSCGLKPFLLGERRQASGQHHRNGDESGSEAIHGGLLEKCIDYEAYTFTLTR